MWKKGYINGMSEEMLEEKRQQQKDYPHFEIIFGYKASELLKKHNEGELDDEGYIIFN